MLCKLQKLKVLRKYEILSSKIKMWIKCYLFFNDNLTNVWKSFNIASSLSKNLPKVNIIIYWLIFPCYQIKLDFIILAILPSLKKRYLLLLFQKSYENRKFYIENSGFIIRHILGLPGKQMFQMLQNWNGDWMGRQSSSPLKYL